jgi:thiamine-monophosphate kinase
MPGESQIISSIRRRARKTSSVVVGIGDDAAVVRPTAGMDLIACCDLMVEGVHFRRAWAPAKLIGRKALAVTLSDIAAMGGLARFAMISIALPHGCSDDFVDELLEGIFDMADECQVSIIGGDTSSSSDSLFIDTTVVGECERGRAITRSGAQVGDGIYVTGELGASALGLMLLAQGVRLGDREPPAKADPADNVRREALIKHLAPVPRLAVGRAIAERGLASAMIDISDGLSTDLSHILDESGIGAVIKAGAIPIAGCVESFSAVEPNLDSLELALNGGEEYELLFTSGRECRGQVDELSQELGIRLSDIGEVVVENGLQLDRDGSRRLILPAGYEHAI